MKVPSLSIIKACYHCGNTTLMREAASFRNEFERPNETHAVLWKLIFCPVCSNVMLEKTTFKRNETNSSSGVYITTGDHIPKIEIIYPIISSKLSIPDNVSSAYEAALKARNIDGAVCALALRRTLEKVCKDKGELSGNLFDKLNNLAKKGILPPILSDMATVLRKIGNAAAHADDTEFPPQLINSSIEFTEIILEYVYIFPAKLSEIQSNFQS